MIAYAGVSRLQQVELLTRGLDLPFPPLADRLLRVIACSLAAAWQDLLAEHAQALLSTSEPEISGMMCTRLNRMIAEDRRWKQLVVNVSRGEESYSFDAESFELRADLSLRLSGRNPSFPLVVECKLLDPSSAKGLARFVKGAYAWAVREGFMLAYVLDGSTLDGSLKPHLKKYQAETPDPFATTGLPTPMGGMSLELRRSVHERGFTYPGRTPGMPGPIARPAAR